jgi:hypothetical protein
MKAADEIVRLSDEVNRLSAEKCALQKLVCQAFVHSDIRLCAGWVERARALKVIP